MIGAGLISEGSSIVIKRVGLNQTRIGMLEVLKIRSKIEILKEWEAGKEPVGDIKVEFSEIEPIEVMGTLYQGLLMKSRFWLLLQHRQKVKVFLRMWKN